MILERLSEGTRRELEARTTQELRALAYEMASSLMPGLPSDLDPVALVRDGRRG